MTGLRSRSQRNTTRAVGAARHIRAEARARRLGDLLQFGVRHRLIQRAAVALERVVEEDRARLDTDEVKAEKQRGWQVRVGEIDCAVEFDQLFELFRRAEPPHAALDIAADRMAEMLLRDLFTARVAPFGEAQLQIDMDDALAVARNLVEQPAEPVAQAGDETIGQQREQFQQPDRKPRAIAAQHATSREDLDEAFCVTGSRKAEELT